MSTDEPSIDEKRLAVRVERKVLDGLPITREERATLRRVEAANEQRRRWEHYRTIPKAHWREMAGGRQHKALSAQAERWGFPIDGAVVDLPRFIRFFHEWLEANGDRLRAADAEEAAIFAGVRESDEALIRFRNARADLAEVELGRRRRELLDRADLRNSLGLMAAAIRRAGDALQRTFGPDAHRVLEDAIDECEQAIDGMLGGGDGAAARRSSGRARG